MLSHMSQQFNLTTLNDISGKHMSVCSTNFLEWTAFDNLEQNIFKHPVVKEINFRYACKNLRERAD